MSVDNAIINFKDFSSYACDYEPCKNGYVETIYEYDRETGNKSKATNKTEIPVNAYKWLKEHNVLDNTNMQNQ